MNQKQTGSTSALIAVLLLGIGLVSASFSSIFISIAEQELSATAVAFNRLWLTSVIYLIWLGGRQLYQISPKPADQPQIKALALEVQGLTETNSPTNSPKSSIWHPKSLMWLGLLGFCFSANQVVWSWSLEHTSIANSTILHNLTPIFTMLGAALFFQEQFSPKFIWGALLATLGAIAIEIQDLGFSLELFQGDLAALASAILYSGYLLALDRLKARLGIAEIILGYSLIGTSLVAPLLWLQGGNFFPHSLQTWITVVALALICQVLGQALIAYCLKTLSVGLVSLAHLLCPCFTAIAAWSIFGEGLNMQNIVGFAVILAGLYYTIPQPTKTLPVGSVSKL